MYLKINDTPLAIASDAITIEANNPAFDQDNIDRTFSYPFTLKDSPKISEVLQHANRIDSVENGETLPGELYIENIPVKSGSATVTAASESGTKIDFSNIPVIDEELEKIKIRDLLPPIEFNLGDRPYPEVILQPAPIDITEERYEFYIRNTLIWSDNANTTNQYPNLEAITTVLVAKINLNWPGLAFRDGTKIRIHANSPEPLLIDYRPTRMKKISLVSSITYAEANRIQFAVFLNGLFPTADHRVSFPCIHTEKFYFNEEGENQNLYYGGVANNFDDGYIIPDPRQPQKNWSNTFIPMVKWKYIFDQIVSNSSLEEIQTTVGTDLDLAKIIFSNTKTLDEVQGESRIDYSDINEFNEEPPFELEYTNGFQRQIDLASRVPDYTAKEFFNLICSQFGLRKNYIDGKLSFSKQKNQWEFPAKSITTKLSFPYTKQYDGIRGFNLKYPTDENESFTEGLDALQLGPGEFEYELPFGTLGNTRIFFFNNIFRKLPRTTATADTPEFDLQASSHPPRILIDHGYQTGADSPLYPFASNDNLLDTGTAVSNFSLEISGSSVSLYELLFKYYIESLAGSELQINTNLSLGDITLLLRWQNTVLEARHPNGSFAGVVKNIRFSADKLGLRSPQTVTLLIP